MGRRSPRPGRAAVGGAAGRVGGRRPRPRGRAPGGGGSVACGGGDPRACCRGATPPRCATSSGDALEAAGDLLAAAEEFQKAAHADATEENLFDWGNNLLRLRAWEPASRVLVEGVKPPSALGPAAGGARDRALLAGAVRRRHPRLRRGRRPRPRRRASLPVPGRDVRRVHGALGRGDAAPRAVRGEAAGARARPLLLRDEPVERRARRPDLSVVESHLKQAIALDPAPGARALPARGALRGLAPLPRGDPRPRGGGAALDPRWRRRTTA